MDQLHDVEPARRAELVHRLHELRGVEAELRLLTAALLPASVAGGRELDADARRRRDTEVVGHREQHVDLAELLDDDEDLVSQLLAHQGEAHELLVLVAVADDEMLRALGQAEHRLQLGLGAALEADAVLGAELHDLLDDVPLLVDLDRVHGRVGSRVLVLADRVREPLAQRLDARAEDVREAQQHRQGDALLFQIAREVVQTQLSVGMLLVRAHHDVPPRVDVEEAGAPTIHVVQRARLVGRPLRLRLGHGSRLDDLSSHP